MSKRIIGIACDHGGFTIKEFVKELLLSDNNYAVVDFGCHSEESVGYPEYAHRLAEAVASGEVETGIALCGSGIGMSMALNKHKEIRAGLCWGEELGRLTRQHNDANVLVLPGRFVDEAKAEKIVRTFLETPFEGGRHIARVEQIPLK